VAVTIRLLLCAWWVEEQYMVLVMCSGEKQQIEMLARFQGEGPECKALLW
jgi:hypothetical protein